MFKKLLKQLLRHLLTLINAWQKAAALVYYREPIILAGFEIIPFLAYLNLTEPRSHSPQKNLASDNLDHI
jgi:hypothetical protein